MNKTIAGLCLGIAAGSFFFLDGSPAGASDLDVAGARKIMQDKLCLTCHTTDGAETLNGAPPLGPTLKGILGSKTTVVVEGAETTVTIDEAYLRKAILKPMAEIKKGYNPIMAPLPMTDEQLDLVIAYIKTL